MFLFEKYKPIHYEDCIFNRNILDQLLHLSSYDDIPHLIISGPSGGGKKTIVKLFLEALYDQDVNILTRNKYKITGSSSKKEIEFSQSNYHIEIEPTNTNHDKHILQEVIKQYAQHKSFNIFSRNRNFKTIIIYNIENLANNSQAALRRTMELYAKSCRFVMICNNLTKIFDPLRSRCRTFCVPLPTIQNISRIISYISLMEKIKLPSSQKKYILSNCNHNLARAIWILDCIRLESSCVIPLHEVFDTVVELILNISENKNLIRVFDDDIRGNIYSILITNISGTEIITTIMDQLLIRIEDDTINTKIIQHASEAEYNLVHKRRDINHIDYFILGVMKDLIHSKAKNSKRLKK
jgi:replication factor C subunit 3/5